MSQADPEEPSREDETADPREFGLAQKGCQAAISEYCEIKGNHPGVSKSRIGLRDIYHHLVKRGECEKAELLREHFRPVDTVHNPDVGRYTEMHADQWWRDVGRPQLRRLPGVEVDATDGPGAEEAVRFTGLPPEVRDEFDDENVVPLVELRGLKEQAADVLDDMGVSGGRRELLLSLYSPPPVGFTNEATAAGLAAKIPDDTRGVRQNQPGTLEHNKREFFDRAIADRLARLPGVSREERGPPDPSELEIETYADVLDAQEALDAEDREVFVFERVDQ